MTNLWQNNKPQEYRYVLSYWRGAKLVHKEGTHEAYSPRAVTAYLHTRGPCPDPSDMHSIQIWLGNRRCSDFEAGIRDMFPSTSRHVVPSTGRQVSAYSAPAKVEKKPPPFAFPDEGFDKEKASG